MVTDKEYIKGSTVSIPNRKAEKDTKKQDLEVKRIQQERRKELIKKQKNNKKNTLQAIALVFICGLIVIWRYGEVYTVQKQLGTIRTEQTTLQRENDTLKIEILKVNNFAYIKDNAESKFNMVEPSKDNAMIADIAKDNFNENLEENKTENSFLQKIKQLFVSN